MTASELTKVSNFENSLRVGSLVTVRWTNNHYYNTAEARITRINGQSIVAELTEEFKNDIGTWPVGHKITVPRCLSHKWSLNNGAFPADNHEETA